MTQAQQLTEHLRGEKFWTWGDVTALRISNSPWARLISEGGLQRYMHEGEKYETRTRDDGLVEMRVLRRKAGD